MFHMTTEKRTQMKKFLLGCIILFVILSCEKEKNEKQPTDVSFENVKVNAIFQESDDITWIGTTTGLFKNQSDDWYDYSEEIAGKEILDIVYYSGSLWLGTVEGLLQARMDGNNMTIETTFDQTNTCIPGSRIQSLGVSPDDRLWVGTDNGICHYDGEKWNELQVKKMLGINVSSIAFDQSDYYIGTYGSHLYHYYVQDLDGTTGASYLIPPFNGELSSDSVFCTSVDNEGNLWFGTNEGLTKNKNGTHVLNGNFTYHLKDSPVYDLDAGEMVYAATNNGLHYYDGNDWKNYTNEDGLPGETVTAVCSHTSGDVWVGTTTGLAKITAGSIQTY